MGGRTVNAQVSLGKPGRVEVKSRSQHRGGEALWAEGKVLSKSDFWSDQGGEGKKINLLKAREEGKIFAKLL